MEPVGKYITPIIQRYNVEIIVDIRCCLFFSENLLSAE